MSNESLYIKPPQEVLATFNLKLPPKLKADFQKLCASKGITASEVIRAFMENETTKVQS
jgi:antitoxin component of RelBE/YafQ-DinJ toxin-antitoxin module